MCWSSHQYSPLPVCSCQWLPYKKPLRTQRSKFPSYFLRPVKQTPRRDLYLKSFQHIVRLKRPLIEIYRSPLDHFHSKFATITRSLPVCGSCLSCLSFCFDLPPLSQSSRLEFQFGNKRMVDRKASWRDHQWEPLLCWNWREKKLI